MVILVVAICVFAFSLYQLVRTMVPYYSGGKEYDKLTAENEKLLQKLEDKKSITDRLDRLERQVAALTGHKLVVEQPVAEEDHGGR